MTRSDNSSRRQFIKTLAYGGISAQLGQELLEEKVHADISVEFTSSVGALRIRPSDYPALDQANGSVRIGINPLRSNHQPNGTFHPILVNRLPNEQLIALSAECTHASCAVRTYNSSANAHVCPCHGSRFGIDGRRMGGPAPFALDTYTTTLRDDGLLEIEVPRLGFTVNGCLEKSAEKSILKLEFPARRSITYQVVKKDRVGEDWTQVAFSKDPDNEPTELEFAGDDTITSLYVPSGEDQGFYAVEVKILDL
ncbi:Rieske (2Fe-2S) protein [Verrucomicrobia bacterium]|jgi:Rieske Fe-S protein|nr:Rieske (2Fe-2S) protein [Verrucomicrobiota bacterium]MDA7866675.1 Rieske (2Fe-2S) protein [Verrucomicrobiota bacterium]MDB4745721.1 Rieske (2Fe-2S) protein [Verrucomicrobiota bacterium]